MYSFQAVLTHDDKIGSEDEHQKKNYEGIVSPIDPHTKKIRDGNGETRSRRKKERNKRQHTKEM